MKNPLVSVLFISYNQVKYVKQALESILNQKTNFFYKIIIGDDCSSDGTREIITALALEHPQKIIFSNPLINLGAAKNFIQLFDAGVNSEAKYISYLEGDDYWTDPYKLQKQVDFMENNPSYSMCFSRAEILKERKTDTIFHYIPKSSTLYFKDIVFTHYIPTLTILFKNIGKLPKWFVKAKSGDRALAMFLTIHGPAKFIDEYMGVYRVHEGGISNTVKQNEKIADDAYYIFKSLFSHATIRQKFVLGYVIVKNRTANYLRKIGIMKK